MFRNRASWLDHFVYSFQHRWETNAQYRAAVSGVVGLALIITMCACTGVVSAATSAALAGIGLGGGAIAGNVNTGTHQVSGAKTFPTPTVVINPGSIPPVTQLSNSQTPPPRPSPTPTTTRMPPGGSVSTCSGGQNSASWVIDPCPLTSGQPGTLTIMDRKHPGAPTNIVIYFCADPACVSNYAASAGYKLDSSGTETISFTVPDQAANSTTPVSGVISIAGGPTMSIRAAPVQ